MKKLFAPAIVLGLGLVASGAFAQVAAPAQGPVAVRPGVVKAFAFTTIKGEITVPSSFSSSAYGQASSLANFQCSNLVIIATSKEMQPLPPAPPGTFQMPVPVWTRSVNATGTWSSGKCSYSMAVRPDSQFGLSAGTTGNFNCDQILAPLANTPTYQTVPRGTTKTDNVTVTKVECTVIG